MSGYKSFVVAESGNLGKFIVELLHAKKDRVTISFSDGHDELVEKDARLIAVGYTRRCRLGAQLAEDTKAAGVKLFVSSDSVIDNINRSYAAIYTEGFSVLIFQTLQGLFGSDLANKQMTVQGLGNAPISWTTRSDISRFLAHALTTSPRKRIGWQGIQNEGDRAMNSRD
ncbi:hypothetical protein ACEPAG_4526 [Sanghuangporus baumii]